MKERLNELEKLYENSELVNQNLRKHVYRLKNQNGVPTDEFEKNQGELVQAREAIRVVEEQLD